jgi:branched-chain amino acid transport system permease protein
MLAGALRTRPWITTALVLALFLVALTAAVDLYDHVLLERILIGLLANIVLVVGLQLFAGNSGLVSFGHVSFMALGAYVAILLTMPAAQKAYTLPRLTGFLAEFSLPFIPGILLAALIVAIVAAIIGFPLMRLSGSAATMATFALLIITHIVLINAETYTRGTRTMYGLTPYTTLWMAVLWAVLSIVASFLFKESRIGLMLRASREQPQAAAASGVNVTAVRWAGFAVSAFITALGGALYAHFITSISPQTMYMHTTFLIVAMLIIGGMESVSGAVVGAVVMTFLFEGLRAIEMWISTFRTAGETAAGFTEIWLGVAMIVLMILRPLGLTMGREIGRLRWPGRRSRAARPAAGDGT